jgi:YHS domain-containing protein
MRAVLIPLLVVMAVWALRQLFAAGPRRSAPDELVKDPVCHTYVVRSRATTQSHAGEVRYFCSPECARQFAPSGFGPRG